MADISLSTRATMAESTPTITYPIPIYLVASRYFLYNVEHITDLRARHHIPGILCGTLPSNPAQNLFLGLPLELMPEEVRLLIDAGHAYIIDDAQAHKNAVQSLTPERCRGIRAAYARLERGKVNETAKLAEAKKAVTLARLKEKKKGPLTNVWSFDTSVSDESSGTASLATLKLDTHSMLEDDDSDLRIFSGASPLSLVSASSSHSSVNTQYLTPTTSTELLHTPSTRATNAALIPHSNPKSHLHAYLHSHPAAYNLSPGLRFGCHFLVYPGDPLRFHSHFLANAYGWDEEIALGDLVGGGRLGTGVKKGFLIGGLVLARDGEDDAGADDGPESRVSAVKPEVRCFCIEWGGM